jgi:hypothetical protein
MRGAEHDSLEEHVATTNASDGGFRRWRRSRPFWGGLLLLIAGLELFLSANLTLGDLEVHMGPEGFLSYLLPLLLVLSGVLSWVTPGQRLFYGVLGLLAAVYSLIGLNLGGFGLGMVLGIVGGALVLAWAPTRPAPPATPASSVADPDAASQPADQPTSRPDDDSGADAGSGGQRRHDPAETMIVPGFTGGPDDRTAHLRPAHQPEPTPEFPGEPAYPGDEAPPSSGIHRKTFVIALIPLVVTAAVLGAGSHAPARADVKCPEGLPSRPAAAAKKEAARQSSAQPSPSDKAAASSPSRKAATSAPSRKATKKTPRTTASVPATSTTPTGPSTGDGADEDGDGTGNPIVDGWNGLVDGVGDLLGGGEAETTAAPEPSTTEVPATPEPTGSATPSDEASSPAPGPSGEPASPTPSASATGSASPSPGPSLSDIPCLGPRVFKKAGPDDVPLVSVKGSTLRTASLTMYNSSYDGVVQLDTAKGKVEALKFSMDKAVNEPFTLTVPEVGGFDTVIESRKLTTDGDVRFYTPEFKGKLFGVIPVTFTPESPPPLTLPVLWFTDVTIDLAFVRCDTLTGDPLKVSPRA